MASNDRDALLALYRSTNGASWSNKDGWDTDAALSQWHGVEANVHGRVVKLTLGRNNLEGILPCYLIAKPAAVL